ncbi:hypothetical protein I317_01617 [Kwoniella heveanensis CBS 569]|nr:hypothetical protein I317_01617 [Kwoniella heveanensis CBS 569]
MSSPLQPLFTTSPLVRPPVNTTMTAHLQGHGHDSQGQCQPFYASPISTHGSHEPPCFTPFALHAGTDKSTYNKHAGFTSASASQPSSAHPSAPPSPIFEELSFAKQPIPSSTAVSTDSEAFSSDWPGSGYASTSANGNRARSLSGAQSPSLISTLFACQSQTSVKNRAARQSQGSSSCSSSSAQRTPSLGSRCSAAAAAAKPILRRNTPSVSMSTSASEDCREFHTGSGLVPGPSPFTPGYGLAVSQVPNEQSQNAPPLKKRPSALTFAVTSPKAPSQSQCQSSFQVQTQSRSRSRSGSVSPIFSQGRTGNAGRIAPISPPSRITSWSTTTETDEQEGGYQEGEEEEGDDDDEEEEDGDDDEDRYVVDSPLPIPGHESDSDEGYQEDSEGGFTSEEDEDGNGDGGCDGTFTTAPRLRHRPSWAAVQWASTSRITGTLTPKRRAATIDSAPAYPTSTDDYEAGQAGPFDFVGLDGSSTTTSPTSRGRKTSIAIVANSKPSSNRCTRHRSPPPPSRSRASSKSVAPAPPAARSPSAAELCRRRGSASMQSEGTLANANSVSACAKARGWRSDDSAFFPSRKPSVPMNSATFRLPSASTSTSAFSGHVSQQYGHGDGRPHAPRKGSLPTPGLSSRCKSILRPPSSIPMQRSSGYHPIATAAPAPAAVPGTKGQHKAKTPSVDVLAPTALARRGSEPVGGVKDAHRKDTMSSDHCHVAVDMRMGLALGRRRGLARSVTACEGQGVTARAAN